MNQPIAKPVIKNKFWVVENHGQKIATIQARDDGGFVYVHDEHREFFPSVKVLKQKYKITFGPLVKNKKNKEKTVYGFPINGKSFNEVWDVQRKLPIYSKTEKSKSLFCAGYYLINFNNEWIEQFCPKLITISRYEYIGPFHTNDESQRKRESLLCKN